MQFLPRDPAASAAERLRGRSAELCGVPDRPLPARFGLGARLALAAARADG